ncbi:MAG: hypothetical protein IK055_01470 [Lachnospiraceae bacterium]|nr:hypothetical protein [Lachnospiraceae bacterium]
MTMYIRLANILAFTPMRDMISRAMESRKAWLFNTGVGFVVLFVGLSFILPRFIPKKVARNVLYSRLSKTSLGLGLLLIFLSLAWGIGFGFGKGKGIGIGSGSGVGITENNAERKKADIEGELDITITGCTVYVDAVEVPIEEFRDHIQKKDIDNVLVVLIDDYSDYGTYSRVVAILDDLLTGAQYEKRKGQ